MTGFGASVQLERSDVECGGVVLGVARWSGNEGHQLVRVVLTYRTQGRGRVDGDIVARADLGTEESGQARFRLDVPVDVPVTYYGQLVQLIWQVAVHDRVTKRSTWLEPRAGSVELMVVPAGWTRRLRPPGTPW